MLSRFRRMGIQKRIMLYVAVGLALMFGGFAFVGVKSIQEATQLVYEERLSAAYTTAGIFGRDFSRVARSSKAALSKVSPEDRQAIESAARSLLDSLSNDSYTFFQVTGVWVLDGEGRLLADVGRPNSNASTRPPSMASAVGDTSGRGFAVLSAVGGSGGDVPFAIIATRVSGQADSGGLVAAVHTVSLNSSAPYMPASYWQAGSETPNVHSEGGDSPQEYQLEVINPEGITALLMWKGRTAGAPSLHFQFVRSLEKGKPAIVSHSPGPGDRLPQHVLAIVPLGSSGFHVVLEQPVDVTLALPLRLQQETLVLVVAGFLVTLLVAWVTTRNVVKPTQQLTVAAERMALGDLGTPIRISAEDEVGKLAQSLDIMRLKLRKATEEISTINRDLESQVRERTARLGEVLRKVITAQEEERYRLARELHDETAQTLGALSIALDRVRDDLQDTSQQTKEQLMEAKNIATRLLEETRRLILDLRPLALDDLGLGPAIRWYAETRLEEKGVATTVEVEQPATRLPKHIEVSLFRLVQEAVNNIAKHANAQHASVRLAFPDSIISLVMTDDGKGFDVNRVLGVGSSVRNVGLLGMQERIKLLNGRFHIRSQEGKGTEVAIEIPLVAESA